MSDQKKAKRLILHAGLPKTATTSIQNAIFRFRDLLLEDAGVFYPGDAANHTNALCTAFLKDPRNHISNKIAGHTDLAKLLVIAGEIRDHFTAEITAAQPETILFSAEGMSNLNAEELGAFRDWALGLAEEISVVYIVRHPLRYTTSVMQQHIKGGEVLEDMYTDPPMANFKGRIGNAIAAFGREHVSVFTFEDMVAHPEGVVGFFLDKVGVRPGKARSAIVEGQEFDNESLSHEAALILSSLNRQRPAFVDGRHGPLRTLNELPMIETIRGEKFFLPAEVHRLVAERAAPDVAWLKEVFGIDAYDDALVVPDDTPESSLSPQTVNSLAILLSNLINDRQVNTLLQRARVRQKAGTPEELRRLAEDIRRIAPNRRLPEYLTKLLDS